VPQPDGRVAKVPKIGIAPTINASVTDPRTWHDLSRCYRSVLLRPHFVSGVGFVLTEDLGWAGLDLDRCLDGGRPKPWAQTILDLFPPETWWEVTPSGRGLRSIVRARPPFTGSKVGYHDGAVEAYRTARFLTITGRLYDPETKPQVVEAQHAIDRLLELVPFPALQAAARPAPGVSLADHLAPPDPAWISGLLELSPTFGAAWHGRRGWVRADGSPDVSRYEMSAILCALGVGFDDPAAARIATAVRLRLGGDVRTSAARMQTQLAKTHLWLARGAA
jgi:hypothetical protein